MECKLQCVPQKCRTWKRNTCIQDYCTRVDVLSYLSPLLPPCVQSMWESESVCMCISEREAGLLAEQVSGQKGGGPSREPQPLLGVRAERMKPVIREVRGRKLSVGVGIVLGAGGWDGSLVPQITRPPAAIVAEWKGPMGGSQGWGGNPEQWSVGERSPWVLGGGGFYTVVSLFFVDSSSRTGFLSWIFNRFIKCLQKNYSSNIYLVHITSVSVSLFLHVCRFLCVILCFLILQLLGVGGEVAWACRLNSKGWHLRRSSVQSQDLSLVQSVLRGRVTQIMGNRREKTKDQSFPLYWRSWTEPLTACHSSEHQTTNRTQ